MDLYEKTREICEELSTGEKPLVAKMIRAKDHMQRLTCDFYIGINPKKWLRIFYTESPTFTLEEKNKGTIVLTSLSREYDEKIKEIAKKNEFGYNLDKPKPLTLWI
jgi:hypothetical protein